MRFMVYQRRMLVEAMKTKAILTAAINPERTEKAAQDYFELAIPVDERSEEETRRAHERELDALADMKPITVGQIKTGAALQGTQQWGTSMHRPQSST